MLVSDISVVIPTRGRPQLLQRTVDSLAAVDAAADLEVIVIDDGSEPSLTLDAGAFPGALHLVRQRPSGLNAARTRGVEMSERPLVAFLDDDVRVERGWAEGVRDAFADGALAVMAGRLIADPEAPLPDWIHPHKLMYLSVLDLGDEPAELPTWATPVGANLTIRRDWLERVGGFREGLDREGASLLSGGDTEVIRRIAAAGGQIRYWPAATAHHHIAAERLTRAWFRRRAEAQGQTDVLATYRRRPPVRVLAREALRPLRAGGIAAKRVAARESLVDAELWLWSCRGRWRSLRTLPR